MSKTKIYDYHTINVKSDTYQAVKKYAGRLQAERGKRVTEDIAVRTLLKIDKNRIEKSI